MVNQTQKQILSCFRSRKYRDNQTGVIDDVLDGKADDRGVKIGIREYKMHQDNSGKRVHGLKSVRGTTTQLPSENNSICPVKLNFKIHKYGHPDEFIFMICGYGNSSHVGHCKPNHGDIPVMKRLLSPETQKLICNGKDASTGSSLLRYLVLKNQNVFVTKSTL
jgi:hypothetical protein